MPASNDASYRDRSRTAYAETEHAEHQTEGDAQGQAQTDWSKKGNESWRTTRQEEFLNNLEARNEKAASAFSSERNLMDFDKDERKQVLEHTVDAFNQMNFANPEDRNEAAQLVAQALFNPMYKEIDLTEARTDARFDAKLLQSLENEGITDYQLLEKPDGTAELHFQVNTLEQYGRIQEQSGYAVRLVEVADYSKTVTAGGNGPGGPGPEIWEPSGYRAIVAEAELQTDVDPLEMQKLVDNEKDKFVRALTGSLHAPGFTVENMDSALHHANAYALGERTTLELDADFKHLLDQDPERAAQLAEVRMDTNFSILDNAIRTMGHDDPSTADGLKYVSEAVRDIHLENIFTALDNRDQTMFHIARDNAKDNADLMAHAVSHGVGLVRMDGYEPPDFPAEGFASRNDINGYVEQIETILEKMNFGQMDEVYQAAVYSLNEQLRAGADAIADQAAAWGTGDAAGLSPQQTTELYESATNIGKGIHHLLKPAVDQPGDTQTDALQAAGTQAVATIVQEAHAQDLTGYADFLNQADARTDFNRGQTVAWFNVNDFDDFEQRELAARDQAKEAFRDLTDMARLLSVTAYDDIPPSMRSNAGMVGYQSFRPSTDRVEDYQEQFAQALAHSDADPARAAGVMAEIRLEAIDYVTADVHDYRRDINFQTIDDLRQSGQMNDATLEHHVLMEKVFGHWHAGRDAMNEIRENNGYDAHANDREIRADRMVMEAHAQEFMDALRGGNAVAFNQAEAHLKETAFDHAFALRNNAGFVDWPDYQAPVLVDEFITAEQGRLYLQEVADSMAQNDWGIDHVYQRAINNLMEESHRGLDYAEAGPGQQHLSVARENAAAIDYLMQPIQASGQEV